MESEAEELDESNSPEKESALCLECMRPMERPYHAGRANAKAVAEVKGKEVSTYS